MGRTTELERIGATLAAGERLVYVVGAPGVGKSRVALDAARAFAAASSARLVHVRLDEAETDLALEDAVAAAARTGTRRKDPRASDALAEIGPAVLVLDPTDRLPAAPHIEAWLEASPELSIVAVQRKRPEAGRVFEIEALGDADAVELLLQCGASARPGLAFTTSEERDAALRIVRELDGLPLAIELAAARLGVMSPQALEHRLKNRWDILRRQGTGRHATLEAAIGWSIDVLPAWAKGTLAACTVFRGGFSLEAAEAVLPAPSGEDAPPLLDALERLRAEALLSAEEPRGLPGEVRLRLPSSVRLYAERALAPHEKSSLEEKHAASFASAAEAWAREVELRGEGEARTHLELERENLVAVVERILGREGVSARAADRALRVLCAVGPVLAREGASLTLEAHLETALAVAQGSGADPRLQARALALRGPLRFARGERAEGDRDLAEALVLASHTGERALEGRVLLSAAQLAARSGQLDRARLATERARTIADQTHDASLRAQALASEGARTIAEGRSTAARACLEEALGLARAQEDRALEASACRRLGALELGLGELEESTGHFERALALATALSDARGEALAHAGLGVARGARGETSEAVVALERAAEAARRSRRVGVMELADTLLGIAHAAIGARGEARALLTEVAKRAELEPAVRAAGLSTLARLERSQERAQEAEALEAAARAMATSPVAQRVLGEIEGEPVGGLARWVVRVLGATPSRSSGRPQPSRQLRIEAGARSFTLDGGPAIDLERRRPLRLLLDALARAHGAGTALSWDALLALGWPGEKMRPDAGAHRVRVAVSTLRKMGLAEVIETGEDGYRIRREVSVVLE